ncbi:MAG: hypothetical protein GXY72_10120 [Deltaproteobacteria bacterium]|nr:hypothetical protein [Deltaproteobacteria bacterium]
MRKYWLLFAGIGLLTLFCSQAMAVDVRFSGEYYAAGLYLDKTTLNKNTYQITPGPPPVYQPAGGSTAFYFQRLRLTTTFVVASGLSLTTRADVMERAWGTARSNPGVGGFNALDTMSAGTRAENENIAFDLLYARYESPIGIFTVGYMLDGVYGTIFGDSSVIAGKVGYAFKHEQFTFVLQTGIQADGERSRTATNPVTDVDKDSSLYTAFVRYNWKTGEVCMLGKYIRNATTRNLYGAIVPDTGFKTDNFIVAPYAKVRLGPVFVQSEIGYVFGKQKWEGNPAAAGGQDADISALNAWIDATADFGIAYIGGSLAYMSGDDQATRDKLEGSPITSGGRDWNPCLIMFNNDLAYWAGAQPGYNATANGAPMNNAYFAQFRAGVRPIDKLDIMASISYATADKTPAAVWVSREYGYEMDLTATYKITPSLSYMLGGGYFVTGDYYKGAGAANEVNNNYLVINKLTLTF